MNRSILYLTAIALTFTIISCNKTSDQENEANNIDISYTFTDSRDGQEYGVKTFGDQVWMDRNLNFANSTGNSSYYNGDSTLANTHGRLYDWQTAIEMAPAGWHIPTKEEWQTLVDHCGGDSIAGGKLKSTDSDFWMFPNLGATNEFGFNAIGSGQVDFNGPQGIYEKTYFWTSSEISVVSELAHSFKLTQLSKAIIPEQKIKGIKCSIRCIRD